MIDLEKMLHLMRLKAQELAKAKADRIYLTEFRKSKKAILYQQAPDGTVAEKEAYAYSHPEYLQVLDALREAVEVEEELSWRMKTAQLQVDVWRTEQANERRERGNYGA